MHFADIVMHLISDAILYIVRAACLVFATIRFLLHFFTCWPSPYPRAQCILPAPQGANAAIKNKNGLTCYEGLDVVRQVLLSRAESASTRRAKQRVGRKREEGLVSCSARSGRGGAAHDRGARLSKTRLKSNRCCCSAARRCRPKFCGPINSLGSGSIVVGQ